MRFETNQWKQSNSMSEDHLKYRSNVASDLINNYLNADLTAKEVIELLGEPNSIYQEDSYYYDLGLSGYGIDPEYLVIEFNNLKLFKVRIERL